MFCHNCGYALPDDAVFCASCGAKMQPRSTAVCASCGAVLPAGASFCIQCGAVADTARALRNAEPVSPIQSGQATSAHSSAPGRTELIGFSARSQSPEILVAAQKNKRSSIGCMWILVVVPLLGFPAAGLLIEDFPFGESLVIGIGIAAILLVINVIALRKSRQPAWEGTVVRRYSKKRNERTSKEDSDYRTYMEFTTVIKTDTGKKKTIVERGSERHMYDYLSEGDRVRFHPAFGTYEKFDKSKDRIIYCNVCSMMNPIQNDRCKRCDNLLFK